MRTIFTRSAREIWQIRHNAAYQAAKIFGQSDAYAQAYANDVAGPQPFEYPDLTPQALNPSVCIYCQQPMQKDDDGGYTHVVTLMGMQVYFYSCDYANLGGAFHGTQATPGT